MTKRPHSAFIYFTGLTILYLLCVFLLPANHVTRSAYNLSAAEYHILLFLVEIPLVAVWFAAFYGYARLTEYAKLITKSAEGADFQSIAIGARWIAWGMLVPSLISLLLNAIANDHPGFHPAALIIINYINLLVVLVGFSFISRGSRLLAHRAKVYVGASGAKVLIFFFVLLGVLFCFFTFRHIDLHHLTNASNVYYLPTWLVVTSVTIPYLYTWFIGLLAAYEILLLGRHASGVLYRRSLQLLALGLVVIIATSSALQYYRGIIPRTGHLSLGATLLVTYLFEIGAGLGFCLLAAGAKRLKKIEEV